MSDDEDSSKSGLSYALLIGLLILIAIGFFMVPFAAIEVALQKCGLLARKPAAVAVATPTPTPQVSKQPSEMASLRSVVEKAASNSIPLPKLQADTNGFQIQVVPPATLEGASEKVHTVLRENHFQFVEAYDHDLIRIIVILKTKEWPELARKLGEATDISGFQYRGPTETSSHGESADSTVAMIQIVRAEK